MLPYMHMFSVFHGGCPPEHIVLCVGDKVCCQNFVFYHFSNTLYVRKCTKCLFKSTATFDWEGQREVLSWAGQLSVKHIQF
jgi:hypothetical protein